MFLYKFIWGGNAVVLVSYLLFFFFLVMLVFPRQLCNIQVVIITRNTVCSPCLLGGGRIYMVYLKKYNFRTYFNTIIAPNSIATKIYESN